MCHWAKSVCAAVCLFAFHAAALRAREVDRLRTELLTSERLLDDVELGLLAGNLSHAEVERVRGGDRVHVGASAAAPLLTLNASQRTGQLDVLLAEHARIEESMQKLSEQQEVEKPPWHHRLQAIQYPVNEEDRAQAGFLASRSLSDHRLGTDTRPPNDDDAIKKDDPNVGDFNEERPHEANPSEQLSAFFLNARTLIVAGCVLLCVGFSHCAGFDDMVFRFVSTCIPYADYVSVRGKLLFFALMVVWCGSLFAMLCFPFTRAILVIACIPFFFLMICCGCLSIVLQAAWQGVEERATDTYGKMEKMYDNVDDLLDFIGIGECSSDDDTVCWPVASMMKKKAAKAKAKTKTKRERGKSLTGPRGLTARQVL